MANYEISGSIKLIQEPKTFPSGFVKREFVLVTDDDYPQTVQFECIKQQCDLLDRVAANDRVLVTFRLRGREYQGRFFVNLEAVGIKKMGAEEGTSTPREEVVERPSLLMNEEPPF